MSDTPIADELAEQLEAGWVVHQWPDHQEGQISEGEAVADPNCAQCGGTGKVTRPNPATGTVIVLPCGC